MPTTYTLIDKYTVPSTSQASITFSSIPQTYKHLVLHFSGKDGRGITIDGSGIYLNGDSDLTKNSTRRFYGNGSTATGNTTRDGQLFVTGSTVLANTFGNSTLWIPDYTNSYRKSWIVFSSQENDIAEAYIGQCVTGSTITAAVSSITIYPETSGNNFLQHTEAHLYGLG